MSRAEKIKYVNIIIVILLMFGMQFLPPIGPLTPTGMHVLGVFLGAVYGWSVIDLIWPSILAIISMSFVEGFNLASVTAAGFGSGTFWIILFMAMFVAALERAGGIEFLSIWFISRKFAQGKPVVFNFIFLLAALLVGMLNGIAACLLFYSILYKICEQVGYKPHDKYPLFMIFGITFAAMFGSISHSLLGSPLILISAFQAASGIQLTLLDWFPVCWPFAVFMILVYSVCIKYVFRCDVKPIQEVDIENIVDMGALNVTPRLKVMFFCTVLLILGLVGGAVLPADWKFTQILNALGLQGSAMLLLALLSYWKVEEKMMFNFKKYSTGIQWDVLFICATIMPMSTMLTMEGTGINDFITSILGGFLTQLPSSIFIAAVLLMSVLLTNLGNNVSICILLMPVILNVCGANGIDPAPLYVCMAFGVHLAMLTPGACPYAALVWGNTEWVSAKEIYKYVPMIMVVFYILIVTVGYQWAKFML